MDKENVVYMDTMDYYSAIKEKEILPFETGWMDLEAIMLNEISQGKNGEGHGIKETKRAFQKLYCYNIEQPFCKK